MDRHAFPVVTTDALGRRLCVDAPPERIVSLVPSQTEVLADLGLDEQVVGVTRFCVHPEDWRDEKTVVGGTKQLSNGTIQALAPDLVLANKEENTPAMVEALDAMAPVYVSDVATLADALGMIRAVGRLTGTAPRADALASEIDAAFAALPSAPPLRVAYLIWRAPYMSVGGDTFIHAMLRHAGFVNAFADQQRYPEVTLQDLGALNLDAVLLASEPFPFDRPRFAEEVREALPHTQVQVVDGELFSWYGSRLLRAPSYFTSLRARLTDAPS
ncbi:MAG: ABC transporter substrate-binding protein [Bacteroidetes bacterium]|jgi:ABC-type Fe3+-hydroxamate transport system substrate-binding protein|nr:ABC transporter substrate-binding protein [Bacteroidota bacterium]